MRITGGTCRGRLLKAPKGDKTRPTSDRTRAAVFNILCHASWGHPEGRNVLDGFCGTGALGLEALSHGAAQAVFIDHNEHALQACRKNVAALGFEDRTKIIKTDLAKKPKLPAGPFDLVFLDPPYGQDLGTAAMENLIAAGCLAPGCIVVLESDKKHPEKIPGVFEVISERGYGVAAVQFLRFIPSQC